MFCFLSDQIKTVLLPIVAVETFFVSCLSVLDGVDDDVMTKMDATSAIKFYLICLPKNQTDFILSGPPLNYFLPSTLFSCPFNLICFWRN